MGDITKFRPMFRGDSSIVATTPIFGRNEHRARWIHRRHKRELVESGAMIFLNGEWLADPDRLAEVLADIGRRDALAALGLPASDRLTATSVGVRGVEVSLADAVCMCRSSGLCATCQAWDLRLRVQPLIEEAARVAGAQLPLFNSLSSPQPDAGVQLDLALNLNEDST